MDALWPATTAVVGVYDEPPPEGGGLSAVELEEGPLTEDFFTAQGLKTAKKMTELKDYLAGLL